MPPPDAREPRLLPLLCVPPFHGRRPGHFANDALPHLRTDHPSTLQILNCFRFGLTAHQYAVRIINAGSFAAARAVKYAAIATAARAAADALRDRATGRVTSELARNNVLTAPDFILRAILRSPTPASATALAETLFRWSYNGGPRQYFYSQPLPYMTNGICSECREHFPATQFFTAAVSTVVTTAGERQIITGLHVFCCNRTTRIWFTDAEQSSPEMQAWMRVTSAERVCPVPTWAVILSAGDLAGRAATKTLADAAGSEDEEF